MKFFAILALCFFIFLQKPALSQEVEDPGKFMERVFGNGSELINKEPTPEGRREVVRRIVLKFFDVPGLGLNALGRLGKKLLPEQQKEFEIRFQKYFCLYNGPLDELAKSSKTCYADMPRKRSEGLNGTVNINGKLHLSGWEKPFDVSYNMLWKGDGWLVLDSTIEGRSSKDKFRTEFNDLITADPGKSYEAVIGYIECRLNGMGEPQCKKRESHIATRGGDN